MQLEKIFKLLISIVGGFFITGIMVLMLPLHLAIPFGLFSAWMWIGAPLVLLYAKNKEDKKDAIEYIAKKELSKE